MPAVLLPARRRAPRRARYLIPPGTARRREITAALSLLALLAGLSLAQITLALAAAFYVAGKLTRWRPAWLAIPAAAGLAWTLIIGPAAALAGLTAVPRALAALLTHQLPAPVRLAQLGSLPARRASWFPGQFPAGLIIAAGLAAAAAWLDWLHTDEWRLPTPRPGLMVTSRRWLTAAYIRSGGVLSRTGICLGVVPATGQPAEIGWPEAEHGVLLTGATPADTTRTAVQLAHAAIRLRKPVIVVDLAADTELPGLLAGAAAAAGAPLLTFTAAGPGCYEPFPSGDPARNAALAAGMIDWAGQPGMARQPGQSVLAGIFAVAGAAPADDGQAVLDDVVALLRPGALAARMDRVPGYWPGRASLASRAAASAARLAADPAGASGLAGQLASVRASPLGRWLGGVPQVEGHQISLPSVIRQRGVALFSLDRAAYGPVAGIIASLVARDLACLAAGLRQAGTGGDGLAWFSQCETADPHALAALVTAGTGAGLATVLSTTSAAAAASLAGQVGVLAVHRLADRALARQLAALTGQHLVPGGPPPAGMMAAGAGPAGTMTAGPGRAGMATAGPRGAVLPPAVPLVAAPPGADWAPVVTGEALCALRAGEFVLIRPGVAAGVVPRAVSVPARIPGGRQPSPEAQEPVPHGQEPVPGGQEPVPGGQEPVPGGQEPVPGGREPVADGRQPPPAGRTAGPRGPAVPSPAPPRAARPSAASASGGGAGHLPPRAVPPPAGAPAAAPVAAPGVPPWPNAPAWAGGQLRRDQPR
jgi:hypothetical protein